MIKQIRLYFPAVVCMVVTLQSGTADATSMMSVEQAKQYISRSFPHTEIKRLKPTAIPGFYEVIIDGTVYYLSEDGTFLLAGTAYNLRTQTNMTEQTYSEMRRDLLNRLNAENTISYAPDNHRYTVYVFSDVNCPYCQKFHSQLSEVNALGIRVNYVLTPYRGENAYRNAVSVWCADDRRAALDRAKRGLAVAAKECKHPIENNLQLAELAGVKGTPAFLLANGHLLNGYRQPHELLKEVRQAE